MKLTGDKNNHIISGIDKDYKWLHAMHLPIKGRTYISLKKPVQEYQG
jgi:hypothetical protein